MNKNIEALNKKSQSFAETVKPVQEWLSNNGCHHETIIIDCNGARFVSDVMGVPSDGNL